MTRPNTTPARRRHTALAPAVCAHVRCLRREAERGSVTVELVLVIPIFIVLLLIIVALGRASTASIQIQDAAQAAARAATLAATPAAAEQAAEQAASQALASTSTTCRSVNVSADVGALTPGSMVRVTVSCAVNYQDLSGIALPGARTISATSSSIVDLYGTTGTGTGG